MRRTISTLGLVLLGPWLLLAQISSLPNAADSVKFAIIGDSGSGDQPQYETAQQMVNRRDTFPYDLVLMVGDNIYGKQDFVQKFERPYRALLDAGVTFQAALGNHDSLESRSYRPFNMGGDRYYSFARKNVRFVVLDTNSFDRTQLTWAANTLRDAPEPWKICYFHHPLYSDGGRHGASMDIRVLLEPVLIANGVHVVFSGHDHIYERLNPQKGIYYFVVGSSGLLRKGDLERSAATAAGFDADRAFMLAEVAGDDMFFEAISRTGVRVDSGVIHRAPRSTDNSNPSPERVRP